MNPEQTLYQGQGLRQPEPEAGIPESDLKEILIKLIELVPMYQSGKKILGDIPPGVKVKYYGGTGKDISNIESIEERESILRKTHRQTMFEKMFMTEDQKLVDYLMDLQEMKIQQRARLQPGRIRNLKDRVVQPVVNGMTRGYEQEQPVEPKPKFM